MWREKKKTTHQVKPLWLQHHWGSPKILPPVPYGGVTDPFSPAKSCMKPAQVVQPTSHKTQPPGPCQPLRMAQEMASLIPDEMMEGKKAQMWWKVRHLHDIPWVFKLVDLLRNWCHWCRTCGCSSLEIPRVDSSSWTACFPVFRLLILCAQDETRHELGNHQSANHIHPQPNKKGRQQVLNPPTPIQQPKKT